MVYVERPLGPGRAGLKCQAHHLLNLDKSLNLFEPQFLICKTGMRVSSSQRLRRLNYVCNSMVFMLCCINDAVMGVFTYLLLHNKHVLLCISKNISMCENTEQVVGIQRGLTHCGCLYSLHQWLFTFQDHSRLWKSNESIGFLIQN